MTDPWQDPTAKRWIHHVIDDMVPKLEGSALVVSMVPNDREGDVKFWVELGASIMLDKPIIAVVMNDAPVPAKLRLVADEVVRLEEGVNPAAADKLAAAVQRVMKEREE